MSCGILRCPVVSCGDKSDPTKWGVFLGPIPVGPKKVREKSRECHNHKSQPFPDPKRKRKPTILNKHKPNKRTHFDFDIVNFPFLDGDVPRRTSYGVYISQLIRFARASSNLNDFNYRNKALTAKLLRQGYRCFKLRKAFSKFYRRHSALLEKYSVSLKTLLQQGISEPEFYGDLVYRFRKIVGKSNFSEQFRKLIDRFKRIGYSLDIMRQTACLVVNSIIVDGYASLFNCTTAVRASDQMTASS